MDVEVADLRLVVAVVEAGSLTRAAARLDQSLNVVSRRLQRVEAAAGVRLVDRTTRRCTPTEAGVRLYRHALAALGHVDAALAELEDERAEPMGTVRVVLPSSAVTGPLLRMLAEVRSLHRRLRIRLVVTRQDLPLGADVDLAVVVGEVPDRAGLVSRKVATVRWGLCAAPAYVAAHGRPERPADLAGHDCLRYRAPEPQDNWTLEDAAGGRVTVAVGGGFESDDSRVLGEAAYAGLGIGIRPREELAVAVADGRLVEILPGWRFAGMPVSLVGRAGASRLPAVRLVADRLAEALSALG